MVFEKLFTSMVPSKEYQLSLPFKDHNTDELYLELYKLQVQKGCIKESSDMHSQITFNILESIAGELSESKQLGAGHALAKQDALAQIAVQKNELSNNAARQISSIDSSIGKIRSQIEQYTKSRIYSEDFRWELLIKPSSDLKYGKVILNGVEPSQRILLYYLFNDTVPLYNLADDDLANTMFNCLPQKDKDFLESLRERNHDFECHLWDYTRKYFDSTADTDYSVPICLIEENGEFDDENMSNRRYDTNLFQYRIAINHRRYGKVYMNKNHVNKDSNGYNYVRSNEKSAHDLLTGNYTSWSGYDWDLSKEQMIFISSKILAQFYKKGIHHKIRVDEQIQPIN